MKQLPQGGIIGKTAAAAKTIAALNIPFRAAYGAYFLILSAFPALLLILNSLRFTQLSVADLTGALENILPEALSQCLLCRGGSIGADAAVVLQQGRLWSAEGP